MSLLQTLQISEPEQLGEIVLSRLGQGVKIGIHPDEGPELYFASNGSPAKLIILDLYTGKVKREFNLNIADAIWAMTIGSDQCVYLAGTSGGILFRYNPLTATLESLGNFPSDPWVWELSASNDHLVYGATYPEAKIFQYNIQTNQYKDLDRADETSAYARSIYATDRHLYVGLGSTVKVMRFDKHTAAWSEIVLDGYSGAQGFAERIHVINHLLFVYVQKNITIVYDLQQNKIVAGIETMSAIKQGIEGDSDSVYYCKDNQLFKWNMVTFEHSLVGLFDIAAGVVLGGVKTMTWIARKADDKRTGLQLALVTAHGYCFVYDPLENIIFELKQDIPLISINIHSLATDDKMLYAGGYHRALSIWNIENDELIHNFPHFPQIEGMAFSAGELYLGIYTQAFVYRYSPNEPIQVASIEEQRLPNPQCLFKIGANQDRPFALAEGDGYIFIGSIADYGFLDGAVTIYNKETNTYKVLKGIVPKQSIVGVAYKDGLLYGSSSVWGGLGINPEEQEAKIFIYDVHNEKIIDIFTPDIPELDAPPRMIGELSIGPDGLLWGIIEGTIFAYDTGTMTLVKSRRYYPSLYQYSKWRPCFLRWGKDGLLYTTLDRKLVIIDPKTLENLTVDERPQGLIAIGADGHLYFADGPMLLRRKISRGC